MKLLLMLQRGKRGKFMMQMDLASESHRLNELFGVTASIGAFMEIMKDLHSERMPQGLDSFSQHNHTESLICQVFDGKCFHVVKDQAADSP